MSQDQDDLNLIRQQLGLGMQPLPPGVTNSLPAHGILSLDPSGTVPSASLSHVPARPAYDDKLFTKIGVERFDTSLDSKTPEGCIMFSMNGFIREELLPAVHKMLREGKMEAAILSFLEQEKLVNATKGIDP